MGDNECSICLAEFKNSDVAVLDCRHKYHFKCIFQWSTQSNQCPMCRCDMTIGRNPQNRMLNQPILPIRRRSCFRVTIDVFRYFGLFSIPLIYLIITLIVMYLQYLQNDYFFNLIKRGDHVTLKARLEPWYGKLSPYLKDESMNDAIRFNKFEIVKLLADNADKYEIHFSKEHLEYAQYHKNEQIIQYIKTSLENLIATRRAKK